MMIAISGLDGSGKSSAIQATIANLKAERIETEYYWGGWRQFEILPLPGLVRIVRKKILEKEKLVNSDHVRKDSSKSTNKTISKYIRELAFIDYVISSVLSHKKMTNKDAILLSDRYIADFIVGIASGHDFSKIDLSLMKALDRILTRADIEFLIDVPSEIALSRKEDVHSLEELNRRRDLYLKIAKIRRMEVIDGRMPIDKVSLEIMKKVSTTK